MDEVNVLVLSQQGLPKDYLETIAAVDPCVSVKDGTVQFLEELHKKGQKGILVERLEREVAIKHGQQAPKLQEDLGTLLAEADIVYGVLIFPESLFLRAPRLKWVHIQSVGVDRYTKTELFGGNVPITTVKGATAVPVAEYVLTFMLMLAKNAPRLFASKQIKRWDRFGSTELCNKTVGIVGLGSVGSEVARMAKGIGMKVLATKRSATKRESDVSGIDELFPLSEFHQMLSESDFVVVAVPLTNETRRMFGEAELGSMKPTAYFINVSRGEIVDESALIQALKEGWIAGAGLDVFQTEPLPPDNELWEMPNVILSYHLAGWTEKRGQRMLEVFCENLKRYLRAEPLLNVVNTGKLY